MSGLPAWAYTSDYVAADRSAYSFPLFSSSAALLACTEKLAGPDLLSHAQGRKRRILRAPRNMLPRCFLCFPVPIRSADLTGQNTLHAEIACPVGGSSEEAFLVAENGRDSCVLVDLLQGFY
jgi:hypothetical protein